LIICRFFILSIIISTIKSFKSVTAYGGLDNERLITSEFLQAMMFNPLVREKLKRMFNTSRLRIMINARTD